MRFCPHCGRELTSTGVATSPEEIPGQTQILGRKDTFGETFSRIPAEEPEDEGGEPDEGSNPVYDGS